MFGAEGWNAKLYMFSVRFLPSWTGNVEIIEGVNFFLIVSLFHLNLFSRGSWVFKCRFIIAVGECLMMVFLFMPTFISTPVLFVWWKGMLGCLFVCTISLTRNTSKNVKCHSIITHTYLGRFSGFDKHGNPLSYRTLLYLFIKDINH